MPISYKSNEPVAKSDYYLQDQNIDILLDVNGEKQIPGTVRLNGECALYADVANGTPVTVGDEIFIDPKAGFQSLISSITVKYRKLGIVESYNDYGRLDKAYKLGKYDREALGTELKTGVEGCAPTIGNSAGLSEGIGGKRGYYRPFSIPLNCMLNNASGPISGEVSGQVDIRIRLASARDFMAGKDFVNGTSGFKVRNLRLTYETIPDDGKREPVQLTYYQSGTMQIDSQVNNYSTYITGLCDAVHISFMSVNDQNDATKNSLSFQPPPGEPPEGYYDYGVTPAGYGIEELNFSINGVDTALLSWRMESREEIIKNGLRAIDLAADRYGTLIREMRDPEYPDGYLAGIPFGGVVDCTNNALTLNIKSKCSNVNQYLGYLHYRMRATIEA